MSLRDDLIPLVDDVRRDVVDAVAGLRIHTVSTRRRVWDGGAPGRGDAVDTDTPLDPVPKVRNATKFQTGEAGRFEQSDLRVEKLSATYAQEDLDGGPLDDNEEWFWLVDGESYRVVEVEERYLEWRVGLKRVRTRP